MASVLDNHDKCRKNVCIVCYKKGKRSISASELGFIQTVLIEGYTLDNLDFPCALCDNCHIILQKKISKEFAVLPQVES